MEELVSIRRFCVYVYCISSFLIHNSLLLATMAGTELSLEIGENKWRGENPTVTQDKDG